MSQGSYATATSTNGRVVGMESRPGRKPRGTGRKGAGRGAAAPTLRHSSRRLLCVGMGCGIPLLSLSLSSIGGRLLCEGHGGLGAATLGLCCAVLAVSLSHLAWAIGDITRSARWQSWCLAVAVDLSLVLGELALVSGFTSWAVYAVMASVTGASAALNCWAFLRHK
jgi:hypothetical protein